MFKRVLSITSAVGLTAGLMGCSGGKKAESAVTQAASTQAESAQETAEASETAKEALGAEGEKKELEAQAVGNSEQATLVKALEGFLNKDITPVNPCEAGGTSDIPVRIYADYISGIMDGAMMNVTDVTGSDSAVGAQQVMSLPGDEYILLVALIGYAVQYAEGSCEFTYEGFKPVGLFVISYLGMTVDTSSSIKTYEDLVQAAESRPGELKSGVIIDGLPMFRVLAMEKREGVDLNIVDIGGTTLKTPKFLSNRIDVTVDSLVGLTGYMGSGDLMIPESYADDRFANYPDMPTSAELGYETNVMNQAFGIWTPKDTPDDVVEYLPSLFETAAVDEEAQRQLTDPTYSASYISTAEYATYLEKIYADFQEPTKELN